VTSRKTVRSTRDHRLGRGRWTCLAALAAVAALSAGCAPVYWLGARLLYDRAPSPPTVRLGVPYDPAAPDDPKRQLDLYLPGGRDFPTVVFVHGGGWAWGDRTQRFGGADVYRNIGRFLASQGIGTAVIGYRLIWTVEWRDQLGDVARAVSWVQAHVGELGGRADRVFLMGHSAGAQLAARIATDPAWLAAAGGDVAGVCGVAAVSGAGYDMGDIETYRAGFDPLYFAERFGGSRLDGSWWLDASVVPWLDAGDPPFLVISATGESGALRRQSALFVAALHEANVETTSVVVRGSSHERIILELSRADKTAGPAVLAFVRDTACPRPTTTSPAAAAGPRAWRLRF
jgi:acetyl esterase/lipase